jgi:hypothetical protein
MNHTSDAKYGQEPSITKLKNEIADLKAQLG